ncbi:glycoside hydrolase family 108 protein [Mameliella alba]|uniref:Secretion activator protein n=1 Tax=Mameliella alba TaxID=561184 RepID=A0A0B3RIJ1_9RHOB|nr:glycoside hydrolase family 108 protein [Mameliella alba]KHQ51085.1 Secretion activator protein [Mameliella alba]
MKQNFDRALALVLQHEGGYVNHPDDPGGATNRGVTQRTYNAWLRRRGELAQDVRNITTPEVHAIYRAQYWDIVRGDDLPNGLDYAVFDFAVNSGPRRATEFLQRILGVEVDGALGEVTLAAAHEADAIGTIADLCDNRLAWLKRLRHWPTFGRGWSRRVSEVRSVGIEMARGRGVSADNPGPPPAPAPQTGTEPRTRAKAQAADNADTLTAGGVLTGLLGGATQTEGAVQLLLVVGVLALVGFIIWRKWKAEA